MNIAIIGSGYVGLVSGAGLAEIGHRVVCVDLRKEVVQAISRGEAPFHEPGLATLLARHRGETLTATTDLPAAVRASDITIVAVGTPFAKGRIDLTQVQTAAREIGATLRGHRAWHVVALKSTVVPGTTDSVVTPMLERYSRRRAGEDFGVGANPEFLREGEAVNDFLNPDRIVIGASDDRTMATLEEVYRPLSGAVVVRTNTSTAETIKYTTNALLATMISFSNEIGNVCTALPDVDVEEVLGAVHLDARLSPIGEDGRRIRPGVLSYLRAGCGFGGSCFPKDVRALIAHAQTLGVDTPMLNATMAVNATQPARVLNLLARHFASLRNTRMAVLGLAFKPNTDDTRESPALQIVQRLRSEGAIVSVYDPLVTGQVAAQLVPGARNAASLRDAISGVDAIIVVTPWDEFRVLPEVLASTGCDALVVDARRALSPEGFVRYDGIGYPPRAVARAAALRGAQGCA